MKCCVTFPVALEQTMYYANHKRHCVDCLTVSSLTIFDDGTVMFGLKDEYGERVLTGQPKEISITLFETEDDAKIAIDKRKGE